jgi:23S rRNA (uridine2552-2'-O)-methyltransferase
VASELVDDEGLVLGVDLREIEPLPAPNVETIVGDARDPEIQVEILERFEGKADVILSDMAPDVTGQWEVDQFRQIHLARVALSLADRLLKDDGWLVVKIFQGGEHVKFLREVKDVFKVVRNYKPKASRKSSAERYVVAHGLKPDRVLPREKTREEWFEEEEYEGPIPGDQLPEEPEE